MALPYGVWAVLLYSVLSAGVNAEPVVPCTIARPVSATEMVRDAQVIVRAQAVEYSVGPTGLTTTGTPNSVVRFKVVETLKGSVGAADLTLQGYLGEKDDFNDHAAPYTFVRPGGRAGSCFANTYRRGAEFLLMLKRAGDAVTVNWYALGPVNEQLRSADDPWLRWVREELKRK